MASFVIHLAVAQAYLREHPQEDAAAFERGVLAPDLLEKPASHYGPASSQPDLDACVASRGLEDSFSRGYYLHLLTDKLFFGEFLQTFSQELYTDYDKVNADIIKAYGITPPSEVAEKITLSKGEPHLFTKEDVLHFIEAVAAIGLARTWCGGELCYRIAMRYLTPMRGVGCRRRHILADRWLARAGEKGHGEALCERSRLHERSRVFRDIAAPAED